MDGQIAALLRVLTAKEGAAELRARVLAHIDSQNQPELADLRTVRSRADLDPMMPGYVRAFLNYALDKSDRWMSIAVL